MSTLKRVVNGDPYVWPEEVTEAIDFARGKDPADAAYENYEGRYLGFLSAPFQAKPHITAWLQAVAEQVQEIDAVHWDTLRRSHLDNAVGFENIAALGYRVLAPVRVAFADSVNRALVDIWAKLSTSEHLWPNLVELFEVFFADIHLTVSGSGYMHVTLAEGNEAWDAAGDAFLTDVMPDIAPAGVLWEYSSTRGEGLYFNSGRLNFDEAFHRVVP